MLTRSRMRTALLAAALVLATACTLDRAGLKGQPSTAAATTGGGGEISPASSTSSAGVSVSSGSGGAGGTAATTAATTTATATSSAASSTSASSSSSGTGGSGGAVDPGPEIAGALLVDLDAKDATAGKPSWKNKGTLGGAFSQQGNPSVYTSGNTKAVKFDGVSDAYIGPVSPVEIAGTSDRTIEVWALNPAITDEEAMVSWSDRTGYVVATMMSFNYGNNLIWGAVTHMHEPDMPWGGSLAEVPIQAVWHHLVYTYDGATARVYVDAAQTNAKIVELVTSSGFSINLAGQREGASLDHFGSLSLAVVRVHDGALTPAQVMSNYTKELPRFQ